MRVTQLPNQIITLRVARPLLLAAACVSFSGVHAGQMDESIGQQTYRDLAENRGKYAAGGSVDIYDQDGNYQGTITNLPSFDNSLDKGQAALVGNPQFLLSVGHDGNSDPGTFTARFGATNGTAFYDKYNDIGHTVGYNDQHQFKYDIRVVRLDKIVTEAEAAPYLTDTSIAANLKNYTLMRVGGGGQFIRDFPSRQPGTEVIGAYQKLTAGTIQLHRVEIHNPANDPSNPASSTTGYIYHSDTYSDTSALPLSVNGGDSGSPIYVFNPNTSQWEYAGSAVYMSSTGNLPVGSGWYYNPDFITNALGSYNSPVVAPTGAGDNIIWNAPDASGNGTLSQSGTSWSYSGLAAGLHGATSARSANNSSTKASDAQLNATRNLIFAGNGATITLTASIDMGAGSLTFDADYALDNAGDDSRRLNSAGFIVNAGATLTSRLTGISGDEWRKVGDGTFRISGNGDNHADLNIGGAGLVLLDRAGGFAANDVKINGGAATVRLLRPNQIGGEVVFGHRGGTLDLYGQDFSDNAITHLDSGATLVNRKENATSTFTFTGSGAHTFQGAFIDGGTAATGLLNLVYSPASATGAVWYLSGISAIGGTVHVNGGALKIQGALTQYADGYTDPDDWQSAVFASGTVSVGGGAIFTAGDHAFVDADIHVAANGTFRLEGQTAHTGTVTLADGTARLQAHTGAGTTATKTGAISGTAPLTKTGDGTLVFVNPAVAIGNLNLNGGTLAQGNGAIVSSNEIFLGNEGGSGTANLSGGEMKTTGTDKKIIVARYDGTGVVNLSGDAKLGTTNAHIVIAENNTGTLSIAGTAVLTVGGAKNLYIGGGLQSGANFQSPRGTLNVNGGTVDVSGGSVVLALGQTTGGTAIPGAVAALNLNGGTVRAQSITKGLGTATLAFNGGTVQAAADSADFFANFAAADLLMQNGGLRFDTNGHAVSIAQELAGTGGLTKLGNGTLILSGTHAYSGNTVVSAGTLILNGTLTHSTLSVQNGATLAGTGTLNVAGDTAFAQGATLALTLAHVSGVAGTDWSQLVVNGTLSLQTELTLLLAADGLTGFNESLNYSFLFASATGGITGFNTTRFQWAGTSLPGNGTWDVVQLHNGTALALTYTPIPEPSSYALLAAAALLGATLFRRKNNNSSQLA